MEVKASVKHLRMSPRKVRLVADLVRGLKVDNALNQLKFSGKWAAKPLSKLINSAIANAEHNYELDKENLLIKEIKVGQGKTLKRWMPKAHGRATPLRKRGSHIDLVLGEIKDSGKKEAKKQEIEGPVKLSNLVKEAETKKSEKEEDNKEETKSAKHTSHKNDGRGQTQGEGKGFMKKMFQRKSG